jgi:DNA-binding HxlR family transcriptional regulator
MEKHRSFCPMNLGLEVFGDKWSILIVRDMMFENKRHFRELLKSEEGIASNILTDRLGMLEREGIIRKDADPGHKQKFLYSLTRKGIDLLPILAEIGLWSAKHQPVDPERIGHARELGRGGKPLQKKMMKALEARHGV